MLLFLSAWSLKYLCWIQDIHVTLKHCNSINNLFWGFFFCTLSINYFLWSSYIWWLIYLNVPFIFQTNYDWSLIKITALLRTAFTPFSCNNNVQITSNEPYILNKAVSSGNEAIDYGSQCLSAGQYLVTLEIPSGSALQAAVSSRRRRRALPDAEIVVDSVSLIHLLYLIDLAGGPDIWHTSCKCIDRA